MRLHQLTSFPLGAMSVMTGWGATGVWQFSDIDGKLHRINILYYVQYLSE